MAGGSIGKVAGGKNVFVNDNKRNSEAGRANIAKRISSAKRRVANEGGLKSKIAKRNALLKSI